MLSNSLHCKLTFIVHSPWFISESEICILHIVKESWNPLDLIHPSCRYCLSVCMSACSYFLKLSAKNLILNPYSIILDFV